MIPKIGEEMLSSQIPEKIPQIAQKAAGYTEFPGKTSLVQSLLGFYENLSRLGSNPQVKPLLRSNNVHKSALETLNHGLEKNNEPLVAQAAIKSFAELVKSHVIAPDDSTGSEEKKDKPAFGKDKTINIEKIIDLLISNLKKFSDNEEVMSAGMKAFNEIARNNPEYIPLLLKQGGPRIALSILENPYTSAQVGKDAIEFLVQLSNDPEAFKLLTTQNAFPTISAFVSAFRGSSDITQAAAPLLQKLADIEAETKQEKTQERIKELLANLGKHQAGQLPQEEVYATLSQLNELTLVDKNIATVLEEKGAQSLLSSLEVELARDLNAIMDAGEGQSHESGLEDLLTVLQRILNSNSAKNSPLVKELIEKNLVENLVKALTSRSEMEGVTNLSTQILKNLLEDPNSKQDVIKRCLEKGLAPSLLHLLETNKEDPAFTNSLLHLLLGLSEASPEVAAKLGDKAFLKALVKETRNILKQEGDDLEALHQAEQNLKHLSALMGGSESVDKIIDEGGVDLASLILAKIAKESKEPTLSDLNISDEPVHKTHTTQHDVLDQLAHTVADLLKKVITNPERAGKILSSHDYVNLMNYLAECDDQATTQNILEILEQATLNNDVANFLAENGCVDKVMAVNNKYPTQKSINDIVGRIINNLGGSDVIPVIVEQLDEISSSYNEKDPESVEAYTSATLYLANLLSSKEGGNTPEIEEKIFNAIEKTFSKTLDNPKLVAAQCLLLDRLAARDEKTAQKLKDSKAIGTIVNGLLSSLGLTGKKKANQIALNTISSAIQQKELPKPNYDPQTGEEITKETEDPVIKSFTENDGAPIKNLLSLLQDGADSTTIEQVLTILEKVVPQSKDARDIVFRENGISTLAQIFNKIPATEHTKNQERLLNTLGAFGKDKDGYEAIVNNECIPAIANIIKGIVPQDLENPESQALKNLNAALVALGNLSNNEFDHTSILESGVLNSIIELLETIKEVTPEDFQNNDYLDEIIKNAVNALQSMAKDPALLRAIAKANAIPTILELLHKLSDATGLAPNQDIDPSKLSELTELKSSDKALDQAIEAVLGFLGVLSKHNKFVKEIPILDGEQTTYQDLLNLVSNRADESLIGHRNLKIFQQILSLLGKDKIKENIEALSPLSEVADTLIGLFPKIEAITKIGEDIKKQVTIEEEQPKVEEQAPEEQKTDSTQPTTEVSSEPQETQETQGTATQETAQEEAQDVSNDLNSIADFFEEIANKIIKNEASQEEIDNIQKLTDAIADSDNLDEEKIIKLQQFGVTNSIAKIATGEKTPLSLKLKSVQSLRKFGEIPKQMEKFVESQELIEGLVNNLNMEGPLSDEQNQLVVESQSLLHDILSNPKAKNNLKPDQIIDLISKLLKDNPKKKELITPSLNVLNHFTFDDPKLANQVESSGLAKTVTDSFDEIGDSLPFYRAYASFIKKTAVNESLRNLYGDLKVIDKLYTGNQKYPEDSILNQNSCLAYASLVLGHPQNGKTFMESDALNHIKYLTENFRDDAQLMENVATLLNNLAYKNNDNKKLLGEKGAIDWVMGIFNQYAESSHADTIRQTLKIIGNLSLIKDNAAKFIEYGFTKKACDLINHNVNNPDLVKLALAVIGNLAVEDINGSINTMLNEGVIPTIQQ